MRVTQWPTSLALALLQASPILAVYWTATSYYAVSLTTTKYATDDDFAFTHTTTYTVKPNVTPTVKTLSTSTYIMSYNDLKIVSVYVDGGAMKAKDLITTDQEYTHDSAYTVFVQPVVYTAPKSCPTPFTVSTYTQVNVPSAVVDQVTPTSTATSKGDSFTYYTEYLSKSAITSSMNPTSDFAYSYFVENCRNPTATGDAYLGPGFGGGGSSSGGGGSSSGDGGSSLDHLGVCSAITGCTTLKIWIIVVATIIPSIFLLGFAESFFWYRRLMLGKSALRFGTVCWVLISLWILCATRNSPSRSPDDQKRLRDQWKSWSFGTKWKLWWKWGFRHRYPVELLGDPNIVGSAPPAPGQPPAMTGSGPAPYQVPSAYGGGAGDTKNYDASVQAYPAQPAPAYYQVQQPDGTWALQAQYPGFPQGQQQPPPSSQYYAVSPIDSSRSPAPSGIQEAAGNPGVTSYEMPAAQAQQPSQQSTSPPPQQQQQHPSPPPPSQPSPAQETQQVHELQPDRDVQELPSPQTTSGNDPAHQK